MKIQRMITKLLLIRANCYVAILAIVALAVLPAEPKWMFRLLPMHGANEVYWRLVIYSNYPLVIVLLVTMGVILTFLQQVISQERKITQYDDFPGEKEAE